MAIFIGLVGHDNVVSFNKDDYKSQERCNNVYYISNDPDDPPDNPLPKDELLLYKPFFDNENIQKILNSFYTPGAQVGLIYNWVGGDSVAIQWSGSGIDEPPPPQVNENGEVEGLTYKDVVCPTVLTWTFNQIVKRSPPYPEKGDTFIDTVIIEYISINGHETPSGEIVPGFRYVLEWRTNKLLGIIPSISITVFPGSGYNNPEYFSNYNCGNQNTEYNGTLDLFGRFTIPIFPSACNENGSGPISVSYQLFAKDTRDMKTDK